MYIWNESNLPWELPWTDGFSDCSQTKIGILCSAKQSVKSNCDVWRSKDCYVEQEVRYTFIKKMTGSYWVEEFKKLEEWAQNKPVEIILLRSENNEQEIIYNICIGSCWI
jgi:hypothetical protein